MPNHMHRRPKSRLRRELRRVRISRRARYTALAAVVLLAGLTAGFCLGRSGAPASGTGPAVSPVDGVAVRADAAEPDIAEKLAVFETVFEDGCYWNHAGAADWLDPVLCVTDTPCAHGTAGESTCNTYRGALLAEFPDFSGIQCFGYASLLSDLLFGVDAPVTAHTDFSRVRVGDMIRLPESMHSMLVTAVDREAETVTVTEVNADYETCRIAWGRTVTREALYANGDSVTFYTRYAD